VSLIKTLFKHTVLTSKQPTHSNTNTFISAAISGYLSLWHIASWGCEWRKPPNEVVRWETI